MPTAGGRSQLEARERTQVMKRANQNGFGQKWNYLAWLILGCFVFLIRQAIADTELTPIVPSTSPWQRPINELTTSNAWASFQAGQYETAISNADRCISRFAATADKIQAALENEKVALPKGKVSPDDRKRVGKYQILHDVATCYLIKGWAKEKLNMVAEARQAYLCAKKYTAARMPAPDGGSFWVPAELASERLTAKSQNE